MILIVTGRAAQFVLLLLANRLATELLPPEQMGRLSLVTASIGLFALFLISPVGLFINRRLHAWDDRGTAQRYLILHWVYLLAVCGVAAVVIATVPILGTFHSSFGLGWLLAIICGSLLFNTINQTAIPSLNLLGFPGRFMLLTLGTIAAGIAISYLLVRRFGIVAEYWLLGQLLSQVLFAAFGVYVLFGSLRREAKGPTISGSQLLSLLQFSWPIALASGFSWVQGQSYRLISGESLGLSQLGLFVAGYGISAGLMAAFESVLTTYFQPRFYKATNVPGTGPLLAWNNYAAAMIPAVIAFTFVLAALAPDLTLFLVGPDYQSASQFVIWGVLAESGRVLLGVISMAAHARMRTNLLLIPNALGGLVCVALVLWLVPGYGADGVGMARSISAAIGVVAVYYAAVSTLRMLFPYRLAALAFALGALAYVAIVSIRAALSIGQGSYINSGILLFVGGVMLSAIVGGLLRRHIQPETVL